MVGNDGMAALDIVVPVPYLCPKLVLKSGMNKFWKTTLYFLTRRSAQQGT
jgi:hypothetical protein